ncbi:flagellar basal-body rod modification protein FlgD [Lachnospiraceae bacterium G11]|nr:flagellar basal-body rod modification protein FlgD [Lachnospiraceae bacterium G11]
MSSIAYVNDKGEFLKTASQESIASQVSNKNKSDMNKDTFLQLLVAQMKYQDPLEPTSNTEYISQYATFTQVEEIQNMAASMELSRASSLVGQEVMIETKDDDGVTKSVQGKVDYVTYENGKAYVSIDESLYSVSDVTSIVDKTYMDAYALASNLIKRLTDLPAVNAVSEKDLVEIDSLWSIYNGMDDYQKTFIASDALKALKEYAERADVVRERIKEYEAAKENETTTEDSTSI